MDFCRAVFILNNSKRDEWIVNKLGLSLTYKSDLNLRIELQDNSTPFKEDWMECYPNKSGFVVEYIIKYGSSFVARQWLIAVDGGRCVLPKPNTDLKVTPPDVNFAKIVSHDEMVDVYLEKSGITVWGTAQ